MPPRLMATQRVVGMKGSAWTHGLALTLVAAAAAIGLRLAGITWGLPYTFNADEPHLVNLAVSFGAGSLKPYAFKYPTLWPYLLFIGYGLYFLTWSFFGLRKGVSDFVGLFAWEPGGFFLIARLLAAAFSLLGVWVLWKAERERSPKRLPWAALLLAFSPVLVELSHSAKPDCLMFALACAGWLFAFRSQKEGKLKDHVLCGLSLGLAVSAQYTAAPALLALPVAHWTGKGRRQPSRLFLGLAAAAGGFIAGTPFSVLDPVAVLEGARDHAALFEMTQWSRAELLRSIWINIWTFAGAGSIAAAAALLGLCRLAFRRDPAAVLLAVPVLGYGWLLSNNPDGGWPRYMLAAYPALALLASEGLAWIEEGRRWRSPALTGVLFLLAAGPGLAQSALMDRRMSLPDTRGLSAAWVLAHVPQGSALLVDEPHASPSVPMAKEQVEELWRQTTASGSPRARLYRGMALAHPGGGYRLYRIRRSARELHSGPRHVELSQADSPTVDLRSGLDPVRALRISYVITSTFGADPRVSPELATFFQELYGSGRLAAVFEPIPGKVSGPVLRIFQVTKSGRA
ncbi:MAG: glycosyltransferase family 39 protein [Elusimicrobia bacterium]|nr:glycosyltransferase family 39 protein [Elusimicrobiota bacterium]